MCVCVHALGDYCTSKLSSYHGHRMNYARKYYYIRALSWPKAKKSWFSMLVLLHVSKLWPQEGDFNVFCFKIWQYNKILPYCVVLCELFCKAFCNSCSYCESAMAIKMYCIVLYCISGGPPKSFMSSSYFLPNRFLLFFKC